MWYSTGCAFNLSDMIMNFPFSKLTITCRECYEITGDEHRDVLVKKVFRECLKLVMEDVIENNATFHLPVVGK
jgi:hypothetical protein